jgi:hypothetical protein
MTLDTPLISPEFRANGRIEIYGQHSACDGSSVTVARAMPAVLEGRLTDSQWNKFCDDLDEALKPAAKMRKIFLVGMIALPIIFITLGAISFITFAMSSKKQFDNFPNNNYDPPHNDFLGSFIFFIIGGIVLFAGFGILTCVGIRSKNSISTGLRKVCDETSARHPGVSFHVRYESRLWTSGYGGHHGFHGHHYDDFGHHHHHHQHVHVSTTEYIEVYVAGATNNNVVPAAVAQAIPVPVPSAPPASYDPEVALGGGGGEKKKSAGERMRELDRMKGLLTEEEYQRKRAEIMSDV